VVQGEISFTKTCHLICGFTLLSYSSLLLKTYNLNKAVYKVWRSTRLLTYLLIPLLTYLFPYLLTYSLTYLLIPLLTYSMEQRPS